MKTVASGAIGAMKAVQNTVMIKGEWLVWDTTKVVPHNVKVWENIIM